ncbi:alpha/beta hydrolase [Rickettsia montanensis]|uniref:Poly-beta-hydroxybutyrate polymerase n=1 Tax=Rickettsia montanensis (strain OSU 85-930) TaxID=1105114 RepID=H8KCL0_RICMS|nr:alpha/beta hydrolase [Rickettsia montanensis]AFC73468.1 poly-beta-hydroxybutyrate polymerase [Rickettsia montanensis str. OSU 85-930]
MLDSNKLQEYFDLYNNYTKTHNLGNKYLKSGKIVMQTEHYRVLCYSASSCGLSTGSSKNKLKMDSRFCENDKGAAGHDIESSQDDIKTFLIIPSIFNSPEIFFLARDKSFIENLRSYGEVYLIDWLEIEEPKYLLDDYVHKIIEVIDNLKIKDINLIGHCIGGNLAIATNVLMPKFIKTLTLLTCPWDFSYFFSITSDKEQELENWLMSGNSISKEVYNQIIQNILDENMFINLKWKIDNFIIDPSLIRCPVYIVAAEDDQIVPKSSILLLQKLLKNSKLIDVAGGHISILVI